MKSYINGTATGWVKVRKSALGHARTAMIKEALTVTPYSFGREEEVDPIEGFREGKNTISLPIAWAVKNLDVVLDDATSRGSSRFKYLRLPDPNHPRAGAGQEKFIADILARCKTDFTVLAKAPTGSGKTASALSAAAQLGRKTIVVVPTVALARQWKKAAKQHLGLKDSDIGWVQSNKCQFKGKSLVIAIINSLVCRRYSDEFYLAFGTAIWDEVHVVAARSFSQSLGLFPARYKIALTATPTRKDGCAALFLNYFGADFVTAKGDAVPCDCVIANYERRTPLKHIASKSVLLSIITNDKDRNAFLVKWIRYLWKHGRETLVLSDRIEHLQKLMRLCVEAGIPSNICGQFTAQRIEGYTTKIKKANKIVLGKCYTLLTRKTGVRMTHECKVRILRKLPDGHYHVKNKEGDVAEVHGVNLRSLPTVVPKYVKVTEDEQEKVKKDSQIIFATYGMFKQGQDVPRLDAGLDATPRSDGIQAIGRIRRKIKGKLHPVWITVRDVGIKMFENNLKSRVRDYRKEKVTVFQYGDQPTFRKAA